MFNMSPQIPEPKNETGLGYAPGSKERKLLQEAIAKLENDSIEIPAVIGGKEVKTGDMAECIQPHEHQQILAKYHKTGVKEVDMAIKASQAAKKDWENMPYPMRSSIFLKAAELLSTKYRYQVNAATMLGQSKNVFQAEIDAACELIDFLNFNVYFMEKIYAEQPLISPKGIWNYVEYRALEGFVFAATPFNFTAIAGNLPTSPAMMGNTVIWKPSSTAVFSNYFLFKVLQEAGLPDGVINFLPGSGAAVGDPVIDSPYFSGIHFTGSTAVFQEMWRKIGNNISKYKTYPRIVGETGGKDFVFVHSSADPQETVTALVRGAFEYQGQKCSAASRAYIPDDLWQSIKERMAADLGTIKMGHVKDFMNFVNAVIDQPSFDKIRSTIKHAETSNEAEVIFGGNCDDSIGYFIEPTVILARNPRFKLMEEEIFGPVLTVYVYPSKKYEETLELCDATSMYGLTGAIFARDRKAISTALNALRHAAGNFYINDKPTGAVVGQQPFGGSRGSGTNDKAGSMQNLLRWSSARAIKETFNPPTDYRYPFMGYR